MASPDGTSVAEMKDAYEIAMGGPTQGSLELSNGMKLECCSPSIQWSADSQFLAVPQWTPDKRQRLIVVDMVNRYVKVFPGIYRVLQIESFEDGTIHGVDSPIHKPCMVNRHISELT